LVIDVLVLGAAFLAFGLVLAFWREPSLAGALGLLVFSTGSAAGRDIGAIAIAYASFLAAAIMTFRLRSASKVQRHEP
jgi:hypothetical protein